MPIAFPNASRSYDTTRGAVRFWGHDSAMETSFYVSVDALRSLDPSASSGEETILRAFDTNRSLIHKIAAKLYARGRKGSYDLQASDF